MLRPFWARRANLRRRHQEIRSALEAQLLEDRVMLSGIDLDLKSGPLGSVGGDLAGLWVDYQATQSRPYPWVGTTNADFQVDNPLLRVVDNRVLIDAIAKLETTTEQLAGDLRQLGMDVTGVFGRVVSGFLPIVQIEAAAALGSLQFARPFAAVSMVGDTTSQADMANTADDTRSTFGVDGSGLTVGVLSDSYNNSGNGSAAADIASGDLPGVGNPLGNTTPVNVLDESDAIGVDEGRAMLQLVHDLAPGADLAFHTANDGVASFAQGILDLAAAGADVIVDDVVYFAEPMFQDGPIAQAVDQVVAGGVPYYSSAINSADDSWEDFGGFNPSGTFAFGRELHDFNSGAGTDVLQQITVPVGTQVIFSFQWDQPFASAGGAGSASDLEIFLYDDGPSPSLTSPLFGSANMNLGGDAVEAFSFFNDGTHDFDGDTNPDTTFNLAILHASGSFAGAMKYVYFDTGGVITVNEYATNSPTSYGHANAAGASSVGAAFYVQTPDFGTNPPVVESFSSLGGVPILFDTSGNRLASPEIRQNVDIVAADGTNTTFFGSDVDADSYPNFFGTSAAAPHAAAIAALMLQANGGAGSATPAQIYAAMETTAINMGDPGYDFLTGHGLVDALAATTALLDLSEFVSNVVNNGSDNRSGIAEIDLTFSQPATIASISALNLYNHTTATNVSLSGTSLQNNGSTTVTLDLSSLMLLDGYYTLEIPAVAVLDEQLTPLSTTATLVFFVLAGDANGSGNVNASDFSDVTTNFSTPQGDPYRTGDTTGDGFVNASDFSPITTNFSHSLLSTPLTFDFGDAAPDSATFPTTLTNDGARHVITGTSLRLGALRDNEGDGQPGGSPATGDDITGSDDEDGVTIAGGALETETPVNISIVVAGTGYLNVWIDFNQDGDWDDDGEHLADAKDLSVSNETVVLPVTAPLGTQGTAIARFRLTDSTGYSYSGLAPNGEVEDYAITISNNSGAAAALSVLSSGSGDSGQSPLPVWAKSAGWQNVLAFSPFTTQTVEQNPVVTTKSDKPRRWW